MSKPVRIYFMGKPASYALIVLSLLFAITVLPAATPPQAPRLNIVGECAQGLLGNWFSGGVRTVVSKLNRETPVGVHFEVFGGNDPRFYQSAVNAKLIKAAQAGAVLIVCGHSLGGNWVWDFADEAKAAGVKIPLAISFDPVDWTSNGDEAGKWIAPDNVAVAVNFRQTFFPGGGYVVAADPSKTKVQEQTVPVSHVNVPNSAEVQSSVLTMVDAVVRREKMERAR